MPYNFIPGEAVKLVRVPSVEMFETPRNAAFTAAYAHVVLDEGLEVGHEGALGTIKAVDFVSETLTVAFGFGFELELPAGCFESVSHPRKLKKHTCVRLSYFPKPRMFSTYNARHACDQLLATIKGYKLHVGFNGSVGDIVHIDEDTNMLNVSFFTHLDGIQIPMYCVEIVPKKE